MEEVERGIHGQIVQLARQLHGTAGGQGFEDPEVVLNEVTRIAADVLPGVDHAGITLVRRSGRGDRQAELTSTGATDEISELADALQHDCGEGPCLTAAWEHETIRIDDVATEQRWPAYIRALRERTPIRATLSVQLFTTDVELGALNLYSQSVDPFDRTVEDLAINLATHAAIALSSARRGVQFRSALASRDIIGQAKGICMERFGVDSLAAFDLLRRLSQETNSPLVEIAEQLVATLRT